jgi:hypothetical protein
MSPLLREVNHRLSRRGCSISLGLDESSETLESKLQLTASIHLNNSLIPVRLVRREQIIKVGQQRFCHFSLSWRPRVIVIVEFECVCMDSQVIQTSDIYLCT